MRHLIPTALPIALLALAASCASDGPTTEQKEKALEQMVETAQQYFNMGELDRANAQCIKGLQLDPENTKLKLIQAWTLQKRGTTEDIAAAENMFRALQDTGDFRAVLGLGEALERRGLVFAEAAERMKSGKHVTEAANPTERVEQYEAEAHKRWIEALGQYERALTMQRQNIDVMNGLVRVHTLLGNNEAAYEWANKLIATSQTDMQYWETQLQRSNLSANDERDYRDMAKAKTKMLTTAQLAAADLAMTLHRDPEALAHLDAAIALEPKRPENFARRAQVRHDLGQYAGAVSDLEQFIALSDKDPNHPDIQRAFRFRRECEELAKTQR